MGVTGLWNILDELGEEKDLNYLSGKRVAIDLSGWVVQAFTTQGLNTINNPHMRNLFFRVRQLLRRDIHPIFVMDGQMPALKEAAFKERNKYGNLSRPALDKYLKECHELLTSLGIPCIKASGEGEACCAFLYLKQKVDGVITEDGDALLYGADTVYRGFRKYNKRDEKSNISKHDIKVYSLKSEKNILKLDRVKLIAFALLLGCDYGKGVPGIGKETALKFLEQDLDVFERFKDWKEMNETQLFPGYDSNLKKQVHCKLCDHIGSTAGHKKEGCELCNSKTTCHRDSKNPCSCAWHKSDDIYSNQKAELKIYKAVKEMTDFPDFKVIDEYLNYTDEIPEQDTLEWKRPNKRDFRAIAYNYLNWSFKYSQPHFLPIMTSWQLSKLSKDCSFDQTDFLYEPVKIVKQKTVKREACFDVQWKLKGQDSFVETEEFVDIFKKSYPKIAETYYKDKSKPKKVSKPMKRKEKIPDFMVSKKKVHPCIQENEIPLCSYAGKPDLEKKDENETDVKKQCSSS